VVGRLVLMYLPDPVATLARAGELVRPRGLICVQEGDLAYDWVHPMTPLWTQVRAWFLETLARLNVASRLALELHSKFVSAGLPAPQMRLESALDAGVQAPVWAWSDVVKGVLPFMEQLGVATADQVQPETLEERLLAELLDADAVLISPPLVAAWARVGE
jgi:hypothetical protein